MSGDATGRATRRVGNSAGPDAAVAASRPVRGDASGREPPRASTPTGPLVRDRVRHFRRPPAPSLEVAQATIMPFGKFHDHTLGQIAAFEPSYIDWVAGTVNHDPDLVERGAGRPGRSGRCGGSARAPTRRPEATIRSAEARQRLIRPETRRSPPDTGRRSMRDRG